LFSIEWRKGGSSTPSYKQVVASKGKKPDIINVMSMVVYSEIALSVKLKILVKPIP